MKKKYIEPKTEIFSTYVMCEPEVTTGSVDGQKAEVKGLSSDIDDEVYESEDGNYGDLW